MHPVLGWRRRGGGGTRTKGPHHCTRCHTACYKYISPFINRDRLCPYMSPTITCVFYIYMVVSHRRHAVRYILSKLLICIYIGWARNKWNTLFLTVTYIIFYTDVIFCCTLNRMVNWGVWYKFQINRSKRLQIVPF